jgi:hypothetical protein
MAAERLREQDMPCLGHLKRAFALLDRLHDVGAERDSFSNATHSRVNSSMTVRIRSFIPRSVRSSTKSYAHTCPGRSARHGSPTPIPRRFRRRRCRNSRPNFRHSRRNPYRGCDRASSFSRLPKPSSSPLTLTYPTQLRLRHRPQPPLPHVARRLREAPVPAHLRHRFIARLHLPQDRHDLLVRKSRLLRIWFNPCALRTGKLGRITLFGATWPSARIKPDPYSSICRPFPDRKFIDAGGTSLREQDTGRRRATHALHRGRSPGRFAPEPEKVPVTVL